MLNSVTVLGVCAQVCLTLCDPMNCSPSGSSAHGILQARILEWVTVPSSSGLSRPRDQTRVSCISSLAGRSFTTEPPGKPKIVNLILFNANLVAGTLQTYMLPSFLVIIMLLSIDQIDK